MEGVRTFRRTLMMGLIENGKIAILIVNGGADPAEGKWIKLCLDKLIQNTSNLSFTVYLWNNNVDDHEVNQTANSLSCVRLFQPNEQSELRHTHASALNYLWEQTQKDSPEYVVFLDSDAHPIRNGWLKFLINQLDKNTVLAGVWRDELKGGISPYVHASCLVTTAKYISRVNKDLDFFSSNIEGKASDTLSFLTDFAYQHNKHVFKLRRSNTFNFHRLMGGIYGGYIYHHGAGSRKKITFWDEVKTKKVIKNNDKIATTSSGLLFKYYDEYINFLELGTTTSLLLKLKLMRLSKLSNKNNRLNVS